MLRPQPDQRLRQQRGPLPVCDAEHLALYPSRVSEWSQEVHDRGNTEVAAYRANVPHRGMKVRREQERHARFPQQPGCPRSVDHIRRAALGREGPIAVLGHGRPGAHRDEGGGRRDVEGADHSSAGPAGIHEVGRVGLDPHHRPAQRARRTGHLLRGLPLHTQPDQKGGGLGG